jgi:hypothetical protein
MNDFIQIILNIIISTIFLYNLHRFWEYLKDTYSVRKKKNVGETQMHKYKQIVSELIQKPAPATLSDADIKRMNDDLLAFMEQQPV